MNARFTVARFTLFDVGEPLLRGPTDRLERFAATLNATLPGSDSDLVERLRALIGDTRGCSFAVCHRLEAAGWYSEAPPVRLRRQVAP